MAALDQLQLTVVPLTEAVATLSATFATSTRSLGFSLGDRVCLATASHYDATALTANQEWKTWKGPVTVELIRSSSKISA